MSHPLILVWYLWRCPLVVHAATTIDCGDTVTGSISSGQTITLEFSNDEVRAVTFTDCGSSFDPTLYLRDEGGNNIQSQSSNSCDGDDCEDYSICSESYRETFTMSNLAAGDYDVLLKPFDDGGWFEVEVICDSSTPSPTLGCDDVSVESAGFGGDEALLNGVYEWDHSLYGYTRSVVLVGDVTIEQKDGFWAFYGIKSDGSYSSFCALSDIRECAGRWKVYHSFLEEWVIDDAVTFLHSDCSPPDECDLSRLSARDMDCTFLIGPHSLFCILIITAHGTCSVVVILWTHSVSECIHIFRVYPLDRMYGFE